jgi:hypothetical protein
MYLELFDVYSKGQVKCLFQISNIYISNSIQLFQNILGDKIYFLDV